MASINRTSKNGTVVTDKMNQNFVEGAGITLTITDSSNRANIQIDNAITPAVTYPLPTGALADTFPRWTPSSGVVAPLISQAVHLTTIMLRAGMTISSISFTSGNQAAVGPTHWAFGLYSSARAKLAETADQTSTAWAADTTKTVAMTSPYSVTTSGPYYVAIQMTAGTVINVSGATIGVNISAISPTFTGRSDSGLDALPTTAGALGAPFTTVPYVYVS